jgi:hypothetical protein
MTTTDAKPLTPEEERTWRDVVRGGLAGAQPGSVIDIIARLLATLDAARAEARTAEARGMRRAAEIVESIAGGAHGAVQDVLDEAERLERGQ